jgi:WD40 repeat protein/tRNA A-37 threonylcarbamoyl transferase component Bud32
MTEETIFAEALSKSSPAERAAYLDETCAGDAALREQVEALLKAHAADRDFLAVPAAAQVAAAGEATEAIHSPSSPGANPEATQGERSKGSVGEHSLAFLAPPRKPGSLGRLDHYEVLEVVGHGGMGVVLKVFDDKLHRVSAIKVLAPQMAANGTARQRFIREAQAAAAVAHDHVVAIHAVQEAGPVPYLEMHYVAGISLEDRIKQGGPLQLKEILRIGIQTAAGLAAAHAQGLVHRDVKPANILLENGVQRVKITDFGLARAVDDASLTQSGVIAGTPMYMSPEQARGEAVDHRSDLFSLGSVLYIMCTGRPPFRASSSLAVLKRVCEEAPRPIREINPDIPEWLTAIVGRLHAKDPAQRIQSAAEVAELLSQHLAHLQQPASVGHVFNVPAPRHVGNVPHKSNLRRVMAAAAALLLAGAALAVFFVFHRWEVKPPPADPSAPLVKGTDEAFERLKREDIPPGLLALAGGGDPEQAPPELVALLGDFRFRLPDDRLRGAMAVSTDGKLLAVPCGNDVVLFDAHTGARLRILTGHTGRVLNLAFSPDSRFLACGDDNSARVWDTGNGQIVSTCSGHTNHLIALAFSPDGARLATGSKDCTGRVWDVKTGNELFRLVGHTDWVIDVLFSADGQRLVTGSGSADGSVRLWQADTGMELKRLQGTVVRLSPDGKTLASGTEREVILWNTDTWERRQTLPTPGVWLAFEPDGQVLLTASRNADGDIHKFSRWNLVTGKEITPLELRGKGGFGWYVLSADGKVLFTTRDLPEVPYVRAFDARTGAEQLPHQGHTGRVWSAAVSPDGKHLASYSEDPLVMLWDLANWKPPDTLPPVRTLRGHTDSVNCVAFSPNGKLLASASRDQTLSLWDVETGQEVRTFVGTRFNDIMHKLAFSPDGQTLAIGGEDGGVRLWKLNEDTEARLLCRHSGSVRCVDFSPDGSMLASGGHDRQVWVNDVATGRTRQRLSYPNIVNNVVFSADGKRLAAIGDLPGELHVWDVADWKRLALTAHNTHAAGLAASPVATLFATAGNDGTVHFWDLSAANPRMLTISSPLFAGGHVVFSPQGGFVVTGSAQGAIAILKVPKPPAAYAPGAPRPLPDPVELAKRPSAADALKREDIPEEFLKKAGGGDAAKAPAELVAVLAGKDGHTSPLNGVAISPDGKWLASAANGDAIKLWDLARGALRHTLAGRANFLWDVAFSPDGSLVAGTTDRTVKLWDSAGGKERLTLTADSQVVRIAFAPDGKTLASVSEAGPQGTIMTTVILWDLHTGKRIRAFVGHHWGVWAVGFSPDGKYLATGGMDNTVRLWDVASGWELGTFTGHTHWVRGLAFHPDGRTLASNSADRTIRLWDLAGWRAGDASPPVRVLQGHNMVKEIVWRADGRLLASHGTADGTVRLWDTSSGATAYKVLPVSAPSEPGRCDSVAMTPEGRYLASANNDGTVYVLRVAERGTVYQVPPDPVELQPKAALPAHTGPVTATVYSPDGKTIATAGKDGIVKLWDVGQDKPRLSVDAHKDGVRCIAFAPDGRALATAGFDGAIRTWDAEGKKQRELTGHKGQIAVLLLAPDGSLLAAGESGSVFSWDAGHDKEPKRLPDCADWITHLSLGPDGKSLATSGNDWTVRLWDLAARKEIRTVAERTSACFAPDGKLLATATRTHAIELLDATTAEYRRRLDGHTDTPDGLSFSADGKLLASCSADGGLRVWEASRGQLLAVLRGHKGRAWSVALSSDGQTLSRGPAR